MELLRYRNGATRITFPLRDIDGNLISGAAGLDSEYTTFDDSTNPGSFSDCTNEATEIDSTGIYYLILTAGEQSEQYTTVLVKATDALPMIIEIRNRYPEDEE